MTPEIWTIIGTGIALASLIICGQRSLRSEMAEVRGERPRTELVDKARRIGEPLAETIESAKRMELIVGDVYQMVGLERPESFESTDRKPGTGAKSHVVLVKGLTGENVEQT